MRLRAEQLASHLNQSGPAPVYLISGDEPLQKMECSDQIRKSANSNNINERVVFNVEKGFSWSTLLEESANLSLFAVGKLIQLHMENSRPGNEGSQALVRYTEQLPAGNILVISTGKLDKQSQQSKWFKALEKNGVVIQIWPVDIDQMPAWIQQRIRQQGKNISKTAASLITDYVEGNLLAARQEIDKLCLLVNKTEITEKDVLSAITDSARFDVFDMLTAAQYGQSTRVIRMLNGLREEGIEPAIIYGALMWNLRQLCSMAYLLSTGSSIDKVFSEFRIWENKRKPFKLLLQRHRLASMYQLLQFAIYLDRKIKSTDRDRVWDDLQSLLLYFAGTPVMPINLPNQ